MKINQESRETEISLNPGANISIITGPLIEALGFSPEIPGAQLLASLEAIPELDTTLYGNEGVDIALVGLVTFVTDMQMTIEKYITSCF